jgi:hypothetical protein
VEGVEEPPGQLLTLSAVGFEAGPTRVHMPTCSHRKLPACRLRASDRRCDLREAEPEHLAQHEHCTFEWRQPLEQQKGRHRQ